MKVLIPALIVLTLSFFYQDAYSQKRKPPKAEPLYKTHISLGLLSLNLPVGNYASKDINNSRAGFAKSSINLPEISINRDIGKRWGLSLNVQSIHNKVNTGYLLSTIQQQYGSSINVSLDPTKWTMTWIGIGAYDRYFITTLKNGAKVFLFDRAYLSYVNSTLPDVNIKIQNGSNSFTFSQNSKTSGSFGSQIGVGAFLSSKNERLNFYAGIDYYHTQGVYNNVIFTTNNNNDITTENVKIDQNISMLNFSLGIGYNFGKK